MGARLALGLVSTLALLFCAPGAHAQMRAGCSNGAIGVGRVIDIDTTNGPRFGAQQYPGNEVLREREVVLTFDDGPHRTLTQTVLDTLDAHCTRATFFMVGQRALYYPEIVRDVAQRGHTIATHTWSHQDLARLPSSEARAQVELGISAVQRAAGVPAAPFFRFPYLSDPRDVTAHLRGRHTGIFSIDVDSYDYKTRSATLVIRNVMRQLTPKGRGILLFHDIQPSTAGALNTLLTELKAQGYRVVHMRPQQSQTTLAEFDKRVEREYGGRRLTSLPLPVSARGMVAPAWEPRVTQPALSGSDSLAATAEGAVSTRPIRRAQEDDWRRGLFGGH